MAFDFSKFQSSRTDASRQSQKTRAGHILSWNMNDPAMVQKASAIVKQFGLVASDFRNPTSLARYSGSGYVDAVIDLLAVPAALQTQSEVKKPKQS